MKFQFFHENLEMLSFSELILILDLLRLKFLRVLCYWFIWVFGSRFSWKKSCFLEISLTILS